MTTQVGVREPTCPVNLTVTRAQAWTIYDLLVAKAVVLEASEDEAHANLGSRRYRDAANELQHQLDTGAVKEKGQ